MSLVFQEAGCTAVEVSPLADAGPLPAGNDDGALFSTKLAATIAHAVASPAATAHHDRLKMNMTTRVLWAGAGWCWLFRPRAG